MYKVFMPLLVLVSLLTFGVSAHAAKRDFYQIKIYHLKTEEQEKKVDAFLKDAYLPALHRIGIGKVGVFKPIINPETAKPTDEKLIYVFIPFRSQEDFFKLEQKLAKDNAYWNDGKAYLDAVFSEPPYDRIETILLNAFDKSPQFTLPALTAPHKERVYELRSYEGHTEKISKNKIKMFNDGDEVGLFKRLGFNAVFYAEVVAGSRMPNLMYLTTFENRASRDEHWKAFSADAYWKKLSAMPEYQKNVSKNDTRFLYPTDYSDI
ncbi:NIPSNAP family protein [Runella slithyformis]|uniref:NIPSNAP family containing protein n=1 Tax=Runella slithyformis (strain ATCC 29530 / DSM 19594 / LMG 11500 / NCIMB 11436 / LSU 4) TaxID=761193 RepID=A0A7U3ZR88_RUNSL|nr:NIPSNAP family protein [Runella slithyformis]AEI51906.1 NIPSNAP family containing protein [Runella slithyformis DSM 19594]